MSSVKKRLRPVVLVLMILSLSAAALAGDYIPSNRDTRMNPEPLKFEISTPSDYTLLYDSGDLAFYYKEERDVIAVHDKRNGYTWKTGLDLPFNLQILNAIDEAIEKGETPEYIPQEDRMNTTYTGMANSLITIEYYDSTNSIKRISSGALDGVAKEMKKVDDLHYRLDAWFKNLDIKLKLHIYFDDEGIRYEIKDNEIEGNGTNIMAAVLITPFLGAAGGKKVYWNEAEQDYTDIVPNEMIPGYILLPDGPGALMRFQRNPAKLNSYTGDVYGSDYSQNEYYYMDDRNYTPFKNPSMPVFGIAHGDRQNAFCAYAINGDEYMEVIAMPEGNMTHYNHAYPRFVYNRLYYQVYNKKGDGYFTLMSDRNHFDVNMKYVFLQGDGSSGEPPADYVGMAKVYKDYLLKNNMLKDYGQQHSGAPVRLDFIMSDSRKNILGNEDVVVTTVNDVRDILTELYNEGVTNMNSGFYGWQKGGISLGKPWTAAWNKEIGSAAGFANLFESMKSIGIDVSLAQDYAFINSSQMFFSTNAAKHVNGLYNAFNKLGYPIVSYSFARPDKAVNWLTRQERLISSKTGAGSLTIEGISNILVSDYGKQTRTVSDAIKLYQDAFSKLDSDYTISARVPNQYLWRYVDRFLQAPVFNTQFLFETDTVPFLQMVLAGNMEVYAPYSNFSFYTDKDVLRMIDYNVYPSFILTKQSAHYLSSTNSSDFYSTEYQMYKDLIKGVYDRVNQALGAAAGAKWVDRKVIQNGFIVNSYDNGIEIAINYTDDPVTYKGITVDPVSCSVIRQGE